LNIYTSNRLEILAEQLARIVRDPLPDSVAPEIIVVQSRGMERWVSMELARHNGICANSAFPFPNAYLQQIISELIPDLPDKPLLDPAVLTFRIMKILPGCLRSPGFESLKSYLESDTKRLKLFQISTKIADLFDQYLVFRPDMIFKWEQGREDNWQAQLWRRLLTVKEPRHRAQLQAELLDKIKKQQAEINNLPARISLFGISYLPLFYLQIFVALSRITQVNFLLMNPCQEYWGDIASNREVKKIRAKYSDAANMDTTLHLAKGNRLLAAMGTLGRNFFEMISGLDCRIYEQFQEPLGQDVLAGIQRDILLLRDREISRVSDTFDHADQPDSATPSQQDGEASIQIHSCHSPLREIEVLHDNLLAMFEQDPELAPQEIIVMTPDIESYGPYIQAVFDAQIDEALRIPFSIADQSVRKESRIVDGFLSILDLPGSRISTTDVAGLLEVPGIKEKFDLSPADMDKIEHWIKTTNIRWGIDAQSRHELGLPGFSENTWKTGIERLLLGYALPGKNRRMFSGILPYDHIEGGDVKALGNFLEFLDRLFNSNKTLQQEHSLATWNTILVAILEQFFAVDEESEREIQLLRRLLDNLSQNQELSGFDTAVKIEVVKSYLENLLEQEHLGKGFITRGVTFCAMLPMRSIPFKVVCLVGLDTDAFPREFKPVSFDLMAKKPRIGDRSRRNDDKYLFLEALISARQTLYISYIGQSIQDNTQAPPSVLVSELLDYIKAGFGLSSEQMITRHKLQAFSPAYFKQDHRLFSYSRENFDAVSSRRDLRDSQPFISGALPEPQPEWKDLDIDDLCSFLGNPAKFLLEKRLGIYLGEIDAVAEEREHFSLNGLQKYLLGQDLVEHTLAGSRLADNLPLYRAKGQLPHGNVGDWVYSEMSVDAETFVRKIQHHTQGKQEALRVDLEIAGFRLKGRIANIYAGGPVQIRYATIKPKYLLNAWVYHLVFNALDEDKYLQSSLLMCKDSVREFGRVTSCRDILEHLLTLYWKGLSLPLHFFPESSFEYAQRILIKKQTEPVALNAAKRKWVGSDFTRGESEDPYYDLCFRTVDPLDQEFQNIAKDVFVPLFNHCTEIFL